MISHEINCNINDQNIEAEIQQQKEHTTNEEADLCLIANLNKTYLI